jgi:hypothetical protein
MKRTFLTTTIVLLMLISINRIQAQNTQKQLNQLEMMKQYMGNWRADAGKDTVEVWECQQYGKAFIINVFKVIKGQKVPWYINNTGFDASDSKLKGYVLWPNGNYITWIGLFSSDNKFSGDYMNTFNPATTLAKFEMVFANPKEWTYRMFNKDGVKTIELKFSEAK